MKRTIAPTLRKNCKLDYTDLRLFGRKLSELSRLELELAVQYIYELWDRDRRDLAGRMEGALDMLKLPLLDRTTWDP